MPQTGKVALVVTSHQETLSCAEHERLALADERPRKDYVVLSKLLDADVIDGQFMKTRASLVPRALAKRSMVAGQVAEVWLHRNRYDHILAWADRIGLPMATLFKVTRSDSDLMMVSTWATRPKKAFFFKTLHVETHLRKIFARSRQAELMEHRLGVPSTKLQVEPRGVDDAFFRPMPEVPVENLISSVGWEARDYRTLIDAVRPLSVNVELAVGAIAKPLLSDTTGPVAQSLKEIAGDGLPQNVILTQRKPKELRQMYARSKFVVITVKDVEFDAGVTATTEAMAMGKPVVATRTPGISDLFIDKEHGLYVPPENPAAMREAIEYLLNNPREVERLGRAARAKVEREHRLDDCMQRFADIIMQRSA
jgi:glycosyltransferase involved in cell wall biosynthesis